MKRINITYYTKGIKPTKIKKYHSGKRTQDSWVQSLNFGTKLKLTLAQTSALSGSFPG